MTYRTEVERRARAAYSAQKRTAKQRGIEWQFTFEEWWAWWQEDNRWANRGRGGDKFVMARKGDTGPYSPGNVYCATLRQNVYDVSPDVRRQAAHNGWALHPERRSHLAVRGVGHPRARMVQTPAGVFGSAAVAAEHHGITRQHAARLARHKVDGWRYTGDETH